MNLMISLFSAPSSPSWGDLVGINASFRYVQGRWTSYFVLLDLLQLLPGSRVSTLEASVSFRTSTSALKIFYSSAHSAVRIYVSYVSQSSSRLSSHFFESGLLTLPCLAAWAFLSRASTVGNVQSCSSTWSMSKNQSMVSFAAQAQDIQARNLFIAIVTSCKLFWTQTLIQKPWKQVNKHSQHCPDNADGATSML